MKQIFRTDRLAPFDMQRQSDRLLHIANLNPERVAEGRILRTELKDLLIVAKAMAWFVELILLDVWDRTFQIDGCRVFMKFPSHDLLVSSRSPVTDILRYLKIFQNWRDARLALSVPAMNMSLSALDEFKHNDDVAAARATLVELRATRAGDSGTNLDDIFRRWMQQFARVREVTIMAGNVQGDIVRVVLPHRARILEPLSMSLPAAHYDDPADRAFEVLTARKLWLVRTVTGNQFLIPRGDGQLAPSSGANIAYAKRDRCAIARWQVLNALPSVTSQQAGEVDSHEQFN